MGVSAGVMNTEKVGGESLTYSQRRALQRLRAIPCSDQSDGTVDEDLSDHVCVNGEASIATTIVYAMDPSTIIFDETSSRTEVMWLKSDELMKVTSTANGSPAPTPRIP